MSKLLHVSSALAAASLVSAAFGQDCPPVWSMTAFRQVTGEGLMIYDDGSGPGLFIANAFGMFFLRNDTVTPVPGTTRDSLFHFRRVLFQGEPEHYVLGSGVYRLTGGAWQEVLIPGAFFGDVAVFDDGNGPARYFADIGGVYRLDGATVTRIGSFSANCGFSSLAVWNDGSGERLFVGGFFTSINGVPANAIAAWDGTTWAAVGGGLTGVNPACGTAGVASLCVFDDGSGEKLYAGGDFDIAEGVAAAMIARWNGAVWSPVGSEVSPSPSDNIVKMSAITRHGVTGLWVCGTFHGIGGSDATGVAMWDGTRWTNPLPGLRLPETHTTVGDVLPFPNADSEDLFVAGEMMRTTSGIEHRAGLLRYGCVCADTDDDGRVDLQDLAIVLANFGRTGVAWNEPGNVDHDLTIDLADLSLVLGQFGTECD